MSSTSLSANAANEDLVIDENINVSRNNEDRVCSQSGSDKPQSTDKPITIMRLEDHIKLPHLQQIMSEFIQHTPKDTTHVTTNMAGKSRKQMPGSMTLDEFKSTISKVVATDEYNEYLEKLFIKLDTGSDGFVDWNEFCTHLLLVYRENDYLGTRNEKPFLDEAKIRHITFNKQEPTTKTIAVQGPVRYLTFSKEGCISVWQPQLVLDKHYTIGDHAEDKRRRFQMWVTDAIYMKNCEKVAIGSSSRDIRFYDVSSSQYFEEYHLFGIPDVPYCFDYHYNTKQPNVESLLIFGVDTGAIHLLTFLKPVTQLFETPFKNDGGVQKIFMQDIASHSKWAKHRVVASIHQDIIRQVRYLPENEAIISGSGSAKSSVVICDIDGVKKSYFFRIEKGVECFDHNKNLNLLVTGSSDHLVRLWNPYVVNSPIATLQGHATGVIGVVIHEDFRLVYSYSKDAVVKVWDTKEHACLQTVVLKFPSAIDGRMPEHGQFPIHLQGPPHSALIITCNDYIASLRLGKREEVSSSIEVTHDTQLCGAIYNKLLKQVVTACDSSTISVWELTTGHRSSIIPAAHGVEEITCLTFDASDRRLISGARDGTIKVWNFHNGHNLHNLEPVGEAEVTAIIHLLDKKCILSVGWNEMIVSYDDSDAENKYLPAITSWNGGQLHKDDILTADFAPPNLLATASYDGEIIIWEADTERMYVRLRKGQPPNISRKLEELKTKIERPDSRHKLKSAGNSRPNSRHRASHKVENGQTAPVDKLIFLKARAAIRFTECALLVSSEGGVLRWWNFYSVNKDMGHFYAPAAPDESVLALCTAPDDSVLVTGDTLGIVKCWDIREYCLRFNGIHIPDSGFCYIQEATLTPPPVEVRWRAHDSAVVSVEYVSHDCGNFIVTASTDKTARLWTTQGHFIGTFGQRAPWNLSSPSTWAHPQTPWNREEIPATGTNNNKTTEAEDEMEDIVDVVPEEESQDRDVHVLDSVAPAMVSREKSYISPIQTFLGVKAEQHLIRRQRDRKERRSQFGDQSRLITSGFGQQCVPYHALTAPEWHDVELPAHLPIPQRLRSQGHLHGSNMKVHSSRNVDFSYDHTDLEPGNHVESRNGTRGVASGSVSFSLQPTKEDRLPVGRASSLTKSSKQLKNRIR